MLVNPKEQNTPETAVLKVEEALAEYLDQPIRLFIHDQFLLKQMLAVLGGLGFGSVSVAPVNFNYFQAMRQLAGQLWNFQGLLLVNHPPYRFRAESGGNHAEANLADFYGGVAGLLSTSEDKSQRLMAKCLPVLTTPSDHAVRTRVIEELLPLGVVGAFLLSPQPDTQLTSRLLQQRQREMAYYLLEFFLHGRHKLDRLQEMREASSLRARRSEAESLLREVERLKAEKQYDKAIVLCRKVTEILPDDPEGYLAGGRLLVRRRKYTAALHMFRDAEAVAGDLPTPNLEIGLLRAAQVVDYLQRCEQEGKTPDQDLVETYLQEALESFGQARDKAGAITAVNPEDAVRRRQEAQAAIAEEILALGLGEHLGEQHDTWLAMVGLAQECLPRPEARPDSLPATHLIAFALKAFYDGDLDQAEGMLFKASQDPANFYNACTKLNFLGTQLRRRGLHRRAMGLYTRLLTLEPPSRGVILFNLAVAQLSDAQDSVEDAAGMHAVQAQVLGTVVEALYEEPSLVLDANFYRNAILSRTLEQGDRVLRQAVRELPLVPDHQHIRCLEARQTLERLLLQGRQGQAIRGLLTLAKVEPHFFTHFHQHMSPEILDLALKLQPALLESPEARLNLLGKVLGILVRTGRQALNYAENESRQGLRVVSRHLRQGERPRAARELARLLFQQPGLAEKLGRDDPNVADLCREVAQCLATVEFERFHQAPPETPEPEEDHES